MSKAYLKPNSMWQQGIGNIPPLTAWQAESLRMTAFYNPQNKVSASSWWNEIVGGEPETRIFRPKEGIQREDGPFGQGKLILTVEPVRIDWSHIIVSDRESQAGGIPTLGSFPDSLDKFIPLMKQWFELETCPPVQRLAFGAILLQPVENLQVGYRQLSLYLQRYVQLDPEGSSDFLYSINRSRDSACGVEGLRINRLSKWSVASLKSFGLSIPPTSLMYFPGPEQFACRLELDINTVPDFPGEFSQEELPKIFQELVDFGKEIAEKGDF